jgi:polysaccharide biosynthesis transport protein
MEEMSVASQTPLSNISIVEKAVPPRFASRPKKSIDLAISGVAALLIGLALSFLLEQLDKRLKTPEEIETYLNLPSLAVVPNFAKLAKSRAVLGKAFTITRSHGTPAKSASVTIEPLSPPDRYMSGKSEVYRIIRTNILFSRAGAPPKTVLFTSSIEREGKTSTAVNTAVAFAQTGAPTLLVSADLRQPRCDKMFNCNDALGLSDALVGQCDPHEVIRRIDGQPFFFLSAGSRAPNPAELLTSMRMREIVDSLAERYSFVLFDSAPLMHASETLAIATMVDGVVMVVGAGTPKRSVSVACDRLAMVEAKVLGVVLNGVDIKQPDYREYTRYYYRYDDHDQHGDELIGTRHV